MMNLDKISKQIQECRVCITMLDQAINNLESTVERRRALDSENRPAAMKADELTQSDDLIEARIQIANISVRLISQFSNPYNQEA